MGHEQGEFLADLRRPQIDREGLYLLLKRFYLLVLRGIPHRGPAAGPGLKRFQRRLKHLLAKQAEARPLEAQLRGGLGNGGLARERLEHQFQPVAGAR